MAAASSSAADLGAGSDGSEVSEDESNSSEFMTDSGLDSDQEEHVGCESRAGTDQDESDGGSSDDAGQAEQDEESQPTEQASAPACGMCMRKLVLVQEECDCDGACARRLPEEEQHWQCQARHCDFDICLPCAEVLPHAAAPRSAARSPAAPAAAPPPSAAPPAAEPIRRERHRATLAASIAPQVRLGIWREWQAERASRAAAAHAARSPAASAAASAAAPLNGAAAVGISHAIDWSMSGMDFEGAQSWPHLDPSAPAPAADPAASASADDEQPAPSSAAPAGVAASSASPGTDYALNVPLELLGLEEPGERQQRQLASYLAVGGDEAHRRVVAFARLVMRKLPTEFLADRCDDLFGEMGADDVLGAGGEAAEERPQPRTAASTRAAHAPRRMQVQILPAQPEVPLASLTRQHRCFCCDEEVGTGEAVRCSALQTLASLESELAQRDAIIRAELDAEEDTDLNDLHRAARWFMYRTFVAASYGTLGRGCRVRIPLCVVAAIRCRYRASGCDCGPEAIATCTAHGYTGHREAARG